ncbi:MAG TPA: ATPase [Ruminiclostridium sp.]|nr:ATPase [Ruminiclostridium sp.]
MRMDELLDKLDDMVDKAWGLPLSGGRCVLDAEKVREIIDDMRLNMPKEIPQAKAIVADRMEIIKNAKLEAEEIIKNAENKAKAMVSNDEIVRQAQEKANALLSDAQTKSKEMKKAAADFSDHLLLQSQERIVEALNEIKQARQALKTPQKI